MKRVDESCPVGGWHYWITDEMGRYLCHDCGRQETNDKETHD